MSSDAGVAFPRVATPSVATPIVATPIVEGIITPEAVVLELETAGIASRVFAGAIDAMIQLVAYVVLILVVLLGLATTENVSESTQTAIAGALLFAVIFL